jgi:hypothetical protein
MLRFNRLVTQMNWRLMEGNGQAYYQLGVADSGQLVRCLLVLTRFRLTCPCLGWPDQSRNGSDARDAGGYGRRNWRISAY